MRSLRWTIGLNWELPSFLILQFNEETKKKMKMMKKKKKIMDKKMMKMKKRMKMKNKQIMSLDCSSSCLIPDLNLVVTEILSRLPVKSLMRFKCVCKAWKSIIEEDSNFINLHYTHSQARPGLLIMVPSWQESSGDGLELYLMSGDLHCNGRGANVDSAKRIIHSSSIPENVMVDFLGPVRGLLCLVNLFDVQICNVSTGVVTPWIKSRVSMTVRNQYPECFFGFDPATGNHKVMFLWSGYENSPPVCEVLTVGESSWRIIDSVPPLNPYAAPSICVNGCAYWLTSQGSPPWSDPYNPSDPDDILDEGGYSVSLMVFDFGSEQFRIIPIPEFARLLLLTRPLYENELIDVDGCPTIIHHDDMHYGIRTMKMWKLQDCNNNNKESRTSPNANANTITSSSEKDWTEVVIRLPCSIHLGCCVFFHSIPGEDVIILETYEIPPRRGLSHPNWQRNVKLFRFYRYDLKTETFSDFEVKGIPFVQNDWETDCAI